MSIVRFIARPMLASGFVLAGMDKLRHADDTATRLSPLLSRAADALPFQTNEKALARVIAGAQVGAGALLAVGKFARLSATVLAVISAMNGYVEWRSADTTSKEARESRRKQLLKNVTLTGGVLLAAVDTAGKPGLAWRAEHLAADARKTTAHLASDARKTTAHLAADARKTTGKKLKKADKAVRRAVDNAVGA